MVRERGNKNISLPAPSKKKWKDVLVIDCSEVFKEMLKNLTTHAQTWSNCRHNSTAKYLPGIHDHGWLRLYQQFRVVRFQISKLVWIQTSLIRFQLVIVFLHTVDWLSKIDFQCSWWYNEGSIFYKGEKSAPLKGGWLAKSIIKCNNSCREGNWKSPKILPLLQIDDIRFDDIMVIVCGVSFWCNNQLE